VQIRHAAQTPAESRINVTYPSPTEVDIYNDQTTKGDQAIHTRTLYDGFGREIEKDQFENATTYIASIKSYDALGRVYQTTNPYRPGDATTAGNQYFTTYAYDPLNRVISITGPDNVAPTNSYYGFTTTATDQAGKQRITTTDALGRLIAVTEDPGAGHLNYQTTYAYDALDDLTSVNQSNALGRTFNYDSLKRLTAATNPESGTVAYTYDNVGNMLTKTDARPVTTCFGVWSAAGCHRLQRCGCDDRSIGVERHGDYEVATAAQTKAMMRSIVRSRNPTQTARPLSTTHMTWPPADLPPWRILLAA
jgi:YD repeat-containing protein